MTKFNLFPHFSAEFGSLLLEVVSWIEKEQVETLTLAD